MVNRWLTEIIKIDTVHEGLDFHTTISRDVLEEATKHLISKAAQPVINALKSANLEAVIFFLNLKW